MSERSLQFVVIIGSFIFYVLLSLFYFILCVFLMFFLSFLSFFFSSSSLVFSLSFLYSPFSPIPSPSRYHSSLLLFILSEYISSCYISYNFTSSYSYPILNFLLLYLFLLNSFSFVPCSSFPILRLLLPLRFLLLIPSSFFLPFIRCIYSPSTLLYLSVPSSLPPTILLLLFFLSFSLTRLPTHFFFRFGLQHYTS